MRDSSNWKMPDIKSKTRLLAAVIGVGGVIAMGGMTMAAGGLQAPAAGAAVSLRPALTGAGSTVTQAPVHALPKAPSKLETPAAAPGVVSLAGRAAAGRGSRPGRVRGTGTAVSAPAGC